MTEPEKFKTQMELLRTLTVRVAEDVEQIRIITNYLEDKLDNVRDSVNIKKVRFIMIWMWNRERKGRTYFKSSQTGEIIFRYGTLIYVNIL